MRPRDTTRRAFLGSAGAAGLVLVSGSGHADAADARGDDVDPPQVLGWITAASPGRLSVSLGRGGQAHVTFDQAARAWKEGSVAPSAFELGDRVAVHGTWQDGVLSASLIEPLYESAQGSFNSKDHTVHVHGASAVVPRSVDISQEVSTSEVANVLVTYRVNRITHVMTPYRLSTI